jgi:hypothetical protein
LLIGDWFSVGSFDGYGWFSIVNDFRIDYAVSAALLVAGSLIGLNVMAVLVGASVLTFKGIHPHQVRWLSWLHGEADPLQTSTFAACPLTCEMKD